VRSVLEPVVRLIGSPSRVIDRLFGYDVFIAHRRVDAAGYAALLVQRLDQEKLSTFIDVREYGPGDELSASTLRHIRKATMLVVLGSPATLEPRTPDWVLGEIDDYWAANSGEALHVLPIDFGGTLATGSGQSQIAARLRDVIRLDQPLAALHQPPSGAVIEAITRQFRIRRRATVRLRAFQGIAAVLSALLLASLAAGWLANRALDDARRNLAANYMTAAKDRLESGFRDEAAALAAESLRYLDHTEARRLVTENPPLDLSHVIAADADEVSGFAADVDLPRHRWVAVGFEGRLSMLGLEDKSRSDVRLGKVDLWAVRFTPDGERLLAGDDRGQMYVRTVSDLNRPYCDTLPRFDGRISQFEFLPAAQALLVNAGNSIYIVGFRDGCPSGAPRAVYRSPEGIIEFEFDAPRKRIVIAEYKGLAMVTLSEGAPGPPEHFTLPARPGLSEPLEPAHITLDSLTGKLCVLTLGGDELVFLDTHFAPTVPLDQRPFGAAMNPLRVTAFNFDARGERLVISDSDGNLLVWSIAQGSAQRRLRVHDSAATHTMLRDNTILSLGNARADAAAPHQVLRVVELDAPSSTPVSLMGSNAAAKPQVRSLETSPAGARVLATASDGRVLSFDFASRKVSDVISGLDVSVEWAARSVDGRRIAFFSDNAAVGLWESGGLLRKASFIEESATGLYSAAWLDDGSALAVGGGWTAPLLLPADRGQKVFTGPVKVSPEIRGLVAGPRTAWYSSTLAVALRGLGTPRRT
jgi:TIR domain